MATSHKNIPMPCWSFQPPHPRLACVATTLWSALQSWCSQKKKFPFVPGYFLGRSDASARSQHGPTNGCFTCREGERREQPGQAGGGNCLGSWHCKETNLELWVDQSLLTLPSQLSPLPPWSLRQCPDPQHALTSHMKKQSDFSAR